MAAPTTPLPGAKAHGEDEPLVLQGYLDYHRVVLGIAVMSIFVITTNRILWRPLYRIAEERYRLN